MAYPDYSIVIVSVTENGVTTDYANAFYNDELAKKFYNHSVSEGKRAFYFERPQPTKFERNDAQPLRANTEKGRENQPVPTQTTEQKIAEWAEVVRRQTPAFMILNAMGQQERVEAAMRDVGERTWESWIGFLGMTKKLITGEDWEQAGTIALQVTVSNKRITIRHDGTGFFQEPQIEKIFPDRNEEVTISTENILVTLSDIIAPMTVGTRIIKRIYGGLSSLDFTLNESNTYVPAGIIVYEDDVKRYISNGDGTVTRQNKDVTQPPCPNVGTELSRNFLQDIMYPIVLSDGLFEYALIGYKYEVVTVGQNCEELTTTEDTYLGNGQIVYQTETTNYKSNGNGGVYEEARNTNPDPDPENPDPENPPPPPCPPAGTFLRDVIVDTEMGQSTWTVAGQSGPYTSYLIMREVLADGNCGEMDGEQWQGFIAEGTTLAQFVEDGYTYVVFVGPSGSFDYYRVENETTSEEDGDYVTYDPMLEDGGLQTPNNPSQNPCPEAGKYVTGETGGYKIQLTSSSRLEQKKKTFVLPMDATDGQLYYAASLSATAKTDVFRGYKWVGRNLPDGNCGWQPEDPESEGASLYPQNVNVPAGWYYNGWGKNNVGPTPVRFGLQKYVGKDTLGNDVFKTVFKYVKADGQGGITVQNA